MAEWFRGLDAVTQALLAGVGTWLLTAAGASRCPTCIRACRGSRPRARRRRGAGRRSWSRRSRCTTSPKGWRSEWPSARPRYSLDAGLVAEGGATFAGAVALAIGIALQNFPEGIAVAMPLRREGVRPARAFAYGQASAVVEPFAAVVGAAAVLAVGALLPYALSFAAGAMIYVVVEELIPESQQSGNTDLATAATMVGFAVMMVLDVALG